jgi:nitric oxide reductase NorE protein
VKINKTNHKNIYYPPGGILMWIIIFIELLTFGMAIVAFVYHGSQAPQLFHESRLMLNTTYGTINTVFLLSSGFFMATAVHQFKEHNLPKSSFYFKLTILGGLLFLILKSIEYYEKIDSGITLESNMFFSFYWVLTAFHIIHVIMGLVILTITHHGMVKINSNSAEEDIEACAAFWHLCDLIWLLLFPVLYLLF